MNARSRLTRLWAHFSDCPDTNPAAALNTATLISCRCRFAFDPTVLATFTPEWRSAHEAHHLTMEAVA